jgi:hypothetical protein
MSGRPVVLSISIPVAPDVVWAELERIEDHTEWMADAVAIDFLTEQRRGVGTSFRCATRFGPLRTNDLMTITEWVEGSTMGVRHQGAVSGSGRFTLVGDEDGGTVVTWAEDLTFPWWMGGALGAAVAHPIFRWVWRRNLEQLRRRLSDG